MTLRELRAKLNEVYLDKELLDMPVFLMGEDAHDVEVETLGLSGKGLILTGVVHDEGDDY